MLEQLRRGSPLLFLFITVFVDMIGYGIVLPLLPFYVQQYAAGAALVGLLGSLYAATQLFSSPFLGGLSLAALNLGLMALVPSGWMLYPVVGVLAVGIGLTTWPC